MTTVTSKNTAFLFPGQGSQFPGMGRQLAEQHAVARRLFEKADEILGFSLSALMWGEQADVLNQTENTQPALFVHSMAAWYVFHEHYPDFKPVAVAGHSLGELSALSAAGALSFEDGLRLVRRRGELMQKAGIHAPGGMAAVLGLDMPTLEALCQQASTEEQPVQIANDNCPGQLVVSGSLTAIERLVALAKEAGARRAIPLAVSVAAHSPLMAAAQSEFDQVVGQAEISNPGTPVISNVTALPMITVASIQADLKAQLTSRVRWTETIQYLCANGVSNLIEMGAGTVLTGLAKRITANANAFALGKPEDFRSFDISQ